LGRYSELGRYSDGGYQDSKILDMSHSEGESKDHVAIPYSRSTIDNGGVG
jgi:hypothetical protein